MNTRLVITTAITTFLIVGCADKTVTQADKADAINPANVLIAPLTASRPAEHETEHLRKEIPNRLLAEQDSMHDAIAAISHTQTKQKMLTPQGYTAMASNLAGIRAASEPLDRENYQHFENNPIKIALQEPVSTFSIDVDTGSYSNIRRMLNQGRLPAKDAVRVEEMLNYFDYAYPAPDNLSHPFRVTTEVGPNPWNAKTQLLQIGIKGYEVDLADIPAANLVFLIDVSGSMQSADKLDLLKNGLTMLSKQMRAQDRVSIVVYAGASGVVLEPTAGNETYKITQALKQLTAGGSTNGAAGIRLAYEVAESAYIKDGVNRILLATDGDFNVGTTSFEQLMDLVEEKRKSGIGFSTLGFGSGNYNDHLAEQLANRGNGSYAYIDTLSEASKVLVDQLSSTLLTIAKDVKIQLEFNPEVVSEYRLIGYENRMLRREDFNNDKIDAGEIGAGHTVSALYEITLKGSGAERIDALRYARTESAKASATELAFLKLRYKKPGQDNSKLITTAIHKNQVIASDNATSDRYRFAAAVAGFGQLLRGGDYLHEFDFEQVLELSRQSRGNDENGYRGEFIQLVKLAQNLGSSTINTSRINNQNELQ